MMSGTIDPVFRKVLQLQHTRFVNKSFAYHTELARGRGSAGLAWKRPIRQPTVMA